MSTTPTTWDGDGLVVDTAFPGGNLLVDGIADGVLKVRQDRRDTPIHWFNWAFRLQGAAGRRIEVRFGDGAVVGVRGPAISLDDGRTWRWQDDAATTRRDAFAFTIPAGAPRVRFSMGIPHQAADWEAFAAGQPGLQREVLCQTRHGRHCELARAGDATAPWLVLVTARHHCCEAMAGYALEGVVQAALREPGWHELAELLVVPFVDLDGVEEGDQGKGRHPRDHGRDYRGEAIYPETAAIRRGLAGWADGRRVAVIDLHCPWIAGDHNQHIYQVGSPDPAVAAQQGRLGALLEGGRRGPLPYRHAGYLPYGTAWNTDANATDGQSLAKWAAGQPLVAIATSVEIPYADAEGIAVLPAGARAFGGDLARALEKFLLTA